LESLHQCCRPSCFVEVIVVVNHPEDASESAKLQDEKNLRDVQQWALHNNSDNLHYHVIYKSNVPQKIAGVGYARKTGMDEAISVF